jgi:hypothetical protein
MVRRSAGETIKVFLRKAQDGSYLDMRIWSPGDDGLEQEIGGLTLNLELLPALVQALDWVMGTAMELREGKKGRPGST